MSPSSLQSLRANTKSTYILLMITLLAALLVMTACGNGNASSMMSSRANAAANAGQSGSSSGHSGSGQLKPEAMFVGDYTPELPVPGGLITAYGVNETNGGINQVNNAGDYGTAGLNVNPAGTLLYTTEIGPSLAVYSIAPNGAITGVFDTVNIRAHSFESMPVIHPNNQFVYAAAYFEGVIGYQANQDGTMTELPGNPFKPESFLAGIEPSGNWMYGVTVAMASGAAVIPYKVNSQTGAITADLALMVGIRTANHQFKFGDARMDAQGKFLFVADLANNAIYTYSINQQTGAVQFVGSTSTGAETPGSITATPTDSFLYVGAASQPHILGYSISQSGVLTPINGGKPFVLPPINVFPVTKIKADLTGQYLYANSDFYINGFSIDAKTGNLNSILTPIFDGGNVLTDIAFTYLP